MTASLGTPEAIAERQISFRIENEKIQASADSLAITGAIPFICECANAACTDVVRLTFDEYEAIREEPRRFFNVTGHEAPSVAARAERVSTIVGELTIVLKIGIAGDLASEAYDRAAD